jgi:hypothetical protein
MTSREWIEFFAVREGMTERFRTENIFRLVKDLESAEDSFKEAIKSSEDMARWGATQMNRAQSAEDRVKQLEKTLELQHG